MSTLIDHCKERAVRVLRKIDQVERMSIPESGELPWVGDSPWLKAQRTCADIVIRLDEPLEPGELFQIGNWLIDAECSIDAFFHPLDEEEATNA